MLGWGEDSIQREQNILTYLLLFLVHFFNQRDFKCTKILAFSLYTVLSPSFIFFLSVFPFLYEGAAFKGAKVVELWEGMRSGGGWNFKFERHFNDWEMEEVQKLICIVNSKNLRPQSRGKLRWKETKDGIFTVKSSFDLLEGGRQQLVPVKMIWNSIVPTKVGFFVWEVW